MRIPAIVDAACVAAPRARIYGIERTLGVPNLVPSPGASIVDDHLPFIQAGVPAVDLIDFDYPYRRTLADAPGKCSSGSLAAVGSMLVRYVRETR